MPRRRSTASTMRRNKTARSRPTRRRTTATRRRKPRSTGGRMISNRSIIWKAPSMQVLPQRYFTKLRLRVAGYFTVAGANPVGFANTQSNKVAVVLNYGATSPFTNFGSTAGLAGASTFNTLAPVGYNTLANVHMYLQAQCLAAKFKITLLPSATVNNDNIWITLTPTTNQIANPATINNALDQPYTKRALFKGTTGEAPLKLYVPFAKFLGLKKDVFENDIVGTAWSAAWNANPTQYIDCVINMNMADGIAPSQNIPFEMELTQYWKFYAPVSATLQ